MDITTWCLVLFSAFLHASWNALIKTSSHPHLSISLQAVITGLITLSFIPFFPLPSPHVYPLLISASLVHVTYNLTLASAYKIGDFGLVYPIARGIAPLVVVILSFLFLQEKLSPIELFSLALIVSGISLLAFQSSSPLSHHLKAISLALITGILIASYTVLDGEGARQSSNPHSFIVWLFFLNGLIMSPLLFFKKHQLLSQISLPQLSHNILFKTLLGASLSLAAYWLVVIALTKSPMAPVSALRETSVIIAALISTLILKEPFGKHRIFSAILVGIGTMIIGLHAAFS